MSLDGITQPQYPLTVDGTTNINASSIYLQGQALVPDAGVYLPLTGGTMSGAIGMANNVLTGLPAPVNPSDAVPKSYLTTNYLPYTGATTTTNLNSQNIQTSYAPTTGNDLTNKTYVDTSISGLSAIYVPYTGSSSDTTLGTYKMSSSSAPTTGNNCTNNTYVDGQSALLLPYTGASSDTTLGTYKMSSSSAPTTGNNFTNKTYVDTSISGLSATYVPYTGGTANVILTGTNKFQQAYNALITDTTTVVNRQTLDSAIAAIGAGILTQNNTWTGTNTFNNNLTLGDGYNATFAEIGYINQTYITSATPTTTGITAIAPTPTGTITYSAPYYTMTPSGASTFASFWSSATFTGATRCFFNFTNMSLANAPGSATITVCQANTANTAYVTISSAIALPQSSPMFSGFFSPNSNASYVGQIFFLLSNVKFNPFSWTAFTYGYGTWTVQGNETVNGTLYITNAGTYAPPASGTLGGTGDRIIFWPGSGGGYPYSMGINAGTLWYSTPTGTQHKWYIGGTEYMTLNSSGTLVLTQPSGGNQLQLLNNSANAMYMNFNSNGGAGIAYIGMDNSAGTGLFGSGIPYAFDIGTATATPICFFTNNVTTPRMKIDSTGNTSISGNFTMNQTQFLYLTYASSSNYVALTTDIYGAFYIQTGTSGVSGRLKVDSAGNTSLTGTLTMALTQPIYLYYISTANYANIYADSSGNINFSTGTSGVASRMMITAAGSVGIGGISPSYTLDVNGNFHAQTGVYVGSTGSPGYVTMIPTSSATYCGFTEFRNGATRYGYIGYGTNFSGENCLDLHAEGGWGMDIMTTGHNIFFSTDGNATQKLQIGTVGCAITGGSGAIGALTVNGTDRLACLNITSTTRAGIYLNPSGTGGQPWNIWTVLNGESPTAGSLAFYCPSTGTFAMTLGLYGGATFNGNSVTINGTSSPYVYLYSYWGSGGGTIYNNNVTLGTSLYIAGWGLTPAAWGVTSDRRIKMNIVPVDSMLSTIDKIRIVKYDYIDPRLGREECSVIAQELHSVFPNATTTHPDFIPNILCPATCSISDTTATLTLRTPIVWTDDTTKDIVVGALIRIVVYDTEQKTETNIDTKLLAFTTDTIQVSIWEKYNPDFSLVVYGTQVDDFMSVDKGQLGIIALKGIQELSASVTELQSQITSLQSQLAQQALQFQAYTQKTEERFNTVASLLKSVLPST